MPTAARVSWSSKYETPLLPQTDFGRFGEKLPFDGEISCGSTALAMSIMWLIDNGFRQLMPWARCPKKNLGVDLVRIFEGLAVDSVGGSVYSQPWYEHVISRYLSLKGIDTLHRDIQHQPAPDVAWLRAKNQDQTIVNFDVGWYREDPPRSGTYKRSVQHWLTLIGVTRTGALTINNPSPDRFMDVPNKHANVRQTVGTARFHGRAGLPRGRYLQIRTTDGYYDGGRARSAVLETAYAVTIDAEARTRSRNHAPQPFHVKTGLHVNGLCAPLEALAPLRGRGGILKRGQGELILQNSNATSGANEVHEGLLVSRHGIGTPFGTGPIALSGNGGLALRPTPGATGPIVVTVAAGHRNVVTFEGGNRFELSRGKHKSLTVSVGGRRDGGTPNLNRRGTGTLVIAPRSGLTELGHRERLVVAGRTGNLPRVIHGMVEPSIVGRDRDDSGAFLSYAGNGFVRARATSSRRVPITRSTPTTVYAVEDRQAIPRGQTANAYAVCVGRHGIHSAGPDTTLRLNGDRSGQAGLILNNGRIGAATVEFGDAEGLIYTGGTDGRITSAISGRSGVTFFGPGKLTLSGDNSYTGGTVVNSGEVVVANTTGTGLGFGDVLVRPGAKLTVDGAAAHVAGKISLQRNANMVLNGGTIGGISVDYGHYMDLAGLSGYGTIAGSAEISGMLRAGDRIGRLTFGGPVSFSKTSFYWTLAALDDTAGHEGVHWNSLVFDGITNFRPGFDYHDFLVLLNFTDTTPDPDTDHPFWRRPHRWLLARYNIAPQYFWFYSNAGNFDYKNGHFKVKLDSPHRIVYLTYKPRRP